MHSCLGGLGGRLGSGSSGRLRTTRWVGAGKAFQVEGTAGAKALGQKNRHIWALAGWHVKLVSGKAKGQAWCPCSWQSPSSTAGVWAWDPPVRRSGPGDGGEGWAGFLSRLADGVEGCPRHPQWRVGRIPLHFRCSLLPSGCAALDAGCVGHPWEGVSPAVVGLAASQSCARVRGGSLGGWSHLGRSGGQFAPS